MADGPASQGEGSGLRVHSKEGLHPAAWRAKLKKLDPDTHDLVSFVKQSGSWYELKAHKGKAAALLDRLSPLRKLKLTVETCDETGSEDRN